MSLEGVGSDSKSADLGEMLRFFAATADHAVGVESDAGERIASLAVLLAQQAEMPQAECDCVYFAARLRNIGALSDAASARFDIPARGARLCETIAALPPSVADIVRWQSECWDGTGFPDRLRWGGVPKASQLVHIAAAYVNAGEPQEAFTAVTEQSGRAFAPEQIRTFIMWYHGNGGDIAPISAPHGALDPERASPEQIVMMLAQLVDDHNATPGRALRVLHRAQDVARMLRLEPARIAVLANSALLYGTGELRSSPPESVQFDALARLGIETRAGHAIAAARLAEECASLASVAQVLRARAEWYDGSGAPDGLRGADIPMESQILAICIAHDSVEELHRIQSAAGTQFSPEIVRALAESLKTHA